MHVVGADVRAGDRRKCREMLSSRHSECRNEITAAVITALVIILRLLIGHIGLGPDRPSQQSGADGRWSHGFLSAAVGFSWRGDDPVFSCVPTKL